MVAIESNKNKKLFGHLNEFWTLNPNKISTIKKIISFTSDKESVSGSKHVISDLEKCKKSLPKKFQEFDLKKSNDLMKNVNHNLSNLNKFLHVIDEIFEINDGIETEIIIDDPNIIEVLKNLKIAKNDLENISDYLNLVISIHHSTKNKKDNKIISADDLLSILNAA